MIRALGLCAIALFAAACGGGKQGPCEGSNPLPECSIACDPTPGAPNSCPAGFHCSPDGTCTADCTPGGGECSGAATCDPDGHCVDTTGDGGGGPDADCPNVEFQATRITPTIQLLIDQSGSMSSSFGGSTRYQSLRNALVGTNGVVGQFQAAAYFGATLYTSGSTCPQLQSVPRALNNLAAIRNLIDSNAPDNETPTGESLRETWMDIVANPPPPDSPPIIVLATDGEPDVCADGSDEVTGRMVSVAQAQNAFNAGIRVFILSVGTDVANQHLQQVANAGVGMDPQTGTAPYYVATSPQDLADAFDAIIGGVLSCELMLDGDINPQQAANGTVTLNGMVLMYGTDWELVGTNIIRLLGAACQTLQGSSNPTVTAEFPCGAIIE